MKVDVIGARGMLGTDLLFVLGNAGIDVKGYDLPELDITSDGGGLEEIGQCDWVVNCAAYTDVDGAETNFEKAYNVNRDGARRVAERCRKTGACLMYISTDYVFDGQNRVAYREDATVNPVNVYGKSKLAGEKEIQSAGVKHLIVRTQSLFGLNGKNFVKAIMDRLAKNDGPLNVVNDQISSPTYTMHLADAILRLLKKSKQGIINASASGECSWFEFACAITARIKPTVTVVPVSTSEYIRPAVRPAFSVLDKSLYESWTGSSMPLWQDGLREYLERI
ncbi:MAG: dTDP-4-dehydrorhamnose reductase [Lentisphaerae bacterium RIFOXYA12_FULL_48_11]|nr:MAG: dTDP-4-dehydrorhamnose reductase [Lentisphaerae bacterium RIFOXYA12_FULL_48_11]